MLSHIDIAELFIPKILWSGTTENKNITTGLEMFDLFLRFTHKIMEKKPNVPLYNKENK